MPSPKALLSRLAAFDRAQQIFSPRDRIIVAVSGGPDSVCLLHRIARIAPKKNLSLTVFHLHHGLRGKDADQDAIFVENLAQGLNIPFILKKLPVEAFAHKERRSIEDAARVLRYRTLAAIAAKTRANKIAVGHHADDQAETLILHLMRGKKAKGLAAMAPRRLFKEAGAKTHIQLIRPLMILSRKEIRTYLRAYHLKFRTDRTNLSEKFTRNWVRKRVIPLLEKRNPGIRANLLAIAEDVRKNL